MEERAEQGAAGREEEQQQQAEHFQSWEKFWGRPGYGAPRDTAHKENLMKMLHYPQNAVKNVRAALQNGTHSTFHLFQAPNNVELLTLERLPVK